VADEREEAAALMRAKLEPLWAYEKRCPASGNWRSGIRLSADEAEKVLRALQPDNQ
jgi:hypothetical protein